MTDVAPLPMHVSVAQLLRSNQHACFCLFVCLMFWFGLMRFDCQHAVYASQFCSLKISKSATQDDRLEYLNNVQTNNCAEISCLSKRTEVWKLKHIG